MKLCNCNQKKLCNFIPNLAFLKKLSNLLEVKQVQVSPAVAVLHSAAAWAAATACLVPAAQAADIPGC